MAAQDTTGPKNRSTRPILCMDLDYDPAILQRPSAWEADAQPACRDAGRVRDRRKVPSAVARIEPARIPTLAPARKGGVASKASAATNSATVKPIPARKPVA